MKPNSTPSPPNLITSSHRVSYLLLLLPLILLLPGFVGIPFSSPEALYTDLLISHYPNALYLKQAILEYHSIPLWSPTILSGYPFAANPLSGLWYPLGWVALAFTLPQGLIILIALHLVLGGVGMYRLVRAEGLRHSPALFAALAFELMPKLFAHSGAGHLTLLYAVPWTPWLLLAARDKGRKWTSGVVLALIFLADPRWAAYAGLLWLVYLFAHSQHDTKSLRALIAKQSPILRKNIASAGKRLFATIALSSLFEKIRYLLVSLGITILLSAPLLVPLLEFVSLSTRSHLASAEIFSHSLPPAQLLGLFFPSGGGSVEWMYYAGGAGIVLVIISLTSAQTRKKSRFWLWVAGLSLVFALGSHIPGLELLAILPGFSLLRVPPRTLFLTGIAVAVVSAYSLEELLSRQKLNRGARLSLMGLVAFVLLAGGGIWALIGELPFSVAWGMGAITLAALWVDVARRSVSPQVWMIGLVLLGIVDWGGADFLGMDIRPNERAFAQQSELVEYLSEKSGRFRIYSPSYSLPQHITAKHELELVDGVDPLQIAAYAKFMEEATGVPQTGYSVTLPPFAEGETVRDNAAYIPNPELLGLLNVHYVAAEFDLVVDGLVFREQFGKTRLYENTFALPRAWVQPLGTEPSQNATPAEIIAWEPNHITIEAQGPGLLILSEITYPGWIVKVNGQKTAIETVAGILRGVEISEGDHQIEFLFRPMSVYIGLALLIVGAGLLGLIGLNSRKKS